jgi:Heavy metal binding domain
MAESSRSGTPYICPMHKDVRQTGPGNCPHCGMALLPEGTRFAMLHHMLSNPLRIVIMLGAMAVLMAAAMMMK